MTLMTEREGQDLILRRLRGFAALSRADEQVIASLDDLQRAPAGSELLRDHEPLKPRFLVGGWAARVRWLADGRRQIVSFVIPGDAVGLSERPQPLAVAPVVALTRVQTMGALPIYRGLADPDHHGLRDALHMIASFEEACLIDQIVRLGRQTAYERISHLFMELQLRLRLVGLGTATSFPCPLTQEVIADATGLSVVHVNRTLQQLRREGVLDIRQGQVTVADPEWLAELCDYRAPNPSAWRTALAG